MAAQTKSRQAKPKVQKAPASKAAEQPKEKAQDRQAEQKLEAEESAQREAVQKAAAEKKAAERRAAIESGALIEDGEIEFREVTERAKDTIDQRTAAVIERLRASDSPVMAKELHEELGGAYALYIPVFSTLLAMGRVKRYRRHTGERGGAGIAYLWISD